MKTNDRSSCNLNTETIGRQKHSTHMLRVPAVFYIVIFSLQDQSHTAHNETRGVTRGVHYPAF